MGFVIVLGLGVSQNAHSFLSSAAISGLTAGMSGGLGGLLFNSCQNKYYDEFRYKIPGNKKFKKAEKYFYKCKYKKAIPLYDELAHSNIPEAQARLADIYFYFLPNDKKDLKKAEHWYLKAAQNGEVRAYRDLGKMYDVEYGFPYNPKYALELYQKSYDLGYKLAGLDIATAYDLGRGVKVDKPKAVSHTKELAEIGNATAQMLYGFYLLKGYVGRPNVKEATVWLKKAKKQGQPLAHEMLYKIKKYSDELEKQEELFVEE